MRFEPAALNSKLRLRHFLGSMNGHDPKVTITEAQKTDIRKELVTSELARRLHQHATEEMGYLADLMPVLYRQITGDVSF